MRGRFVSIRTLFIFPILATLLPAEPLPVPPTPAGYPHSIQGLGPDGCEFLLVFNEGLFSEDNTFLLSEWVAHTPKEVLSKNFRLDRTALAKLPTDEMYIFPADLPKSLAQDWAAVGGQKVQSPVQYTFKMGSMTPTILNAGGEARVVDSRNFPAEKLEFIAGS